MPTILVVDDERIIADTLALILRNAGYVATAVYSAPEAIEHYLHRTPDLVLSDVVMAGMNGIELAIRLRDFNPNCNVLLISGNATTHDLLDEARARGYDFTLVAKPIPPEELLNQVKKTLTGQANRTGRTAMKSAA